MTGAPEAALMASALRAGCFARMEDVEATRAELAIVGARGARLSRFPMFAAYLGEAYALAGSTDQRRQSRELLAALAVEHVSGGHVAFTYEGTTTRVIGLLDAALGDHDAAEAHLRAARASAEARGHAPWAAQIAYELAKVLRARGRADDGRVRPRGACARHARPRGERGRRRARARELGRARAREGRGSLAAHARRGHRAREGLSSHAAEKLLEEAGFSGVRTAPGPDWAPGLVFGQR
jgi:hypothetical protein